MGHPPPSGPNPPPYPHRPGPYGPPPHGFGGPAGGRPDAPPVPGAPPPPPPAPSGVRPGLVAALAVGAALLLGGAGLAGALLLISSGDAEETPEVQAQQVHDPTVVPPEFDGVWEGRMRQLAPDGEYNSEWDLRLYLTEGDTEVGGELYVEFGGSLMCTWNMTVEESSADRVELSYRVGEGTQCVHSGEVELELAGPGEIEAYVESPWPEGTTTASGTLR